jgi:starvation-inducible outer membrane lipoprotein
VKALVAALRLCLSMTGCLPWPEQLHLPVALAAHVFPIISQRMLLVTVATRLGCTVRELLLALILTEQSRHASD